MFAGPNHNSIMEKTAKDTPSFSPNSRQAWRQWLEANHRSQQSVWLVYYKKKSGVPSISYSDAVDEALCFGWIDSTKKTIDHETFTQFFCKRKPRSVWSTINKEKVQRLTEAGLMTEAGYESINIAQQNGSWIILDVAETLLIPEDLETAFEAHAGSKDFFLGLSKSTRKAILQWLVLAKQAATRQKRILEIAVLAGQGQKPKQF